MSDLTITTAGVTESKVSGGEFLSSDKKLNQMHVTIVDVEPTVDTSAYAAGDLMFNPIKIENAVGVKGGSAIIQSVAEANDDALTGAFDLVFTASDDAIVTLNNAVSGESGLSDANADFTKEVCSFASVGT